jgi:hypothetical protein
MKNNYMFDELGVMIDCSRNAVPKPETVKTFAGILSKMGYTALQLYTEDVYELIGEPEFGYMRGRYTAGEIRDIDRYCKGCGIELIPCIQTLAHLGNIFKHQKYQALRENDNILYIGEEEVYGFIDKMLYSVKQCFSSPKINLGMDEANNCGLGKMLFKKGYQPKEKLMSRHIKRVSDLAEKYGFDCRVWYDQFAWSAYGDDFYGGTRLLHPEFCENFPKNVALIYWDYGEWLPDPGDEEEYCARIERYRKITADVHFAGGAWKWIGFAPDNETSIKRLCAQADACKRSGIRNFMVTLWGNGGGEASLFSVLPTLYQAACKACNKPADYEYFERITGAGYEQMLSLDKMDKIFDFKSKTPNNQSKAYLFNDLLLGNFDNSVKENTGEEYKKLSSLYGTYSDGKFKYIFDTMQKLCAVLEIKAELGIKLRKAYADKNCEALSKIAESLDELYKRTSEFESAFRKQWNTENKSFGYEVMCIKLGGLLFRFLYIRDAVLNHLANGCEKIEELEQPLLESFVPESPENLIKSYGNLVTYGNLF